MIGASSKKSMSLLAAMSTMLAAAPVRATAQEVTLDDLKGRSIVAEHSFEEDNTIIEEDDRKSPHYGSRFKFKDMIYVSAAGRMFHRTQYFDLNPGSGRAFPQFDNVRPETSDALQFVRGKGLVYRRIPGDTRRDASYVAVVTIALARNGAGLTCSVSRARALKQGQTEYMEYIDPERPKRRKIVYAQRVYNQACSVIDGNVFAQN